MKKLTSAEARRVAEKYLATIVQMKELDEQKKKYEEALRDYVRQTNETEIGAVMAYERVKPAQLVGATGRKLKEIQDSLMLVLPVGYVKKTLDVTRMLQNLQSDKVLCKHLDKSGLTIVQEKEWYFKHVS